MRATGTTGCRRLHAKPKQGKRRDCLHYPLETEFRQSRQHLELGGDCECAGEQPVGARAQCRKAAYDGPPYAGHGHRLVGSAAISVLLEDDLAGMTKDHQPAGRPTRGRSLR